MTIHSARRALSTSWASAAGPRGSRYAAAATPPAASRRIIRRTGSRAASGRRLYESFRSYTEKVWGVPCTECGEWEAAEDRGLSLPSRPRRRVRRRGEAVRAVVQFHYPRWGGPDVGGHAGPRRAQQARCARAWPSRSASRSRADEWRWCTPRRAHSGGTVIPSSHPMRTVVRARRARPPRGGRRGRGRVATETLVCVARLLEGRALFKDKLALRAETGARARVQKFRDWKRRDGSIPKRSRSDGVICSRATTYGAATTPS